MNGHCRLFIISSIFLFFSWIPLSWRYLTVCLVFSNSLSKHNGGACGFHWSLESTVSRVRASEDGAEVCWGNWTRTGEVQSVHKMLGNGGEQRTLPDDLPSNAAGQGTKELRPAEMGFQEATSHDRRGPPSCWGRFSASPCTGAGTARAQQVSACGGVQSETTTTPCQEVSLPWWWIGATFLIRGAPGRAGQWDRWALAIHTEGWSFPSQTTSTTWQGVALRSVPQRQAGHGARGGCLTFKLWENQTGQLTVSQWWKIRPRETILRQRWVPSRQGPGKSQRPWGLWQN